MKEQMSTREKGKRFIAAGTLSALAILGISGCSEQKDASWELAVDCPDEQELNTKNFESHGSIHKFEMSCGEDTMPSSVEIVTSPQLETGGSTIDSAFVVDINATDSTGFFSDGTADIDIFDEDAFTKVVVSNIDSLDRVNILTQE